MAEARLTKLSAGYGRHHEHHSEANRPQLSGTKSASELPRITRWDDKVQNSNDWWHRTEGDEDREEI